MRLEMLKKKATSSKSKKKQLSPPPPNQRAGAQAAPLAPEPTSSAIPPPPTCTTAPLSPAAPQVGEPVPDSFITRVVSAAPQVKKLPTNSFIRSNLVMTVTEDNRADYSDYEDSDYDEIEFHDAATIKRNQERWKRLSDAQCMAQRATHRNTPGLSPSKIMIATADDDKQDKTSCPPIYANTAGRCGSVDDDAATNPSVFSRNGSRVSSGTSSSSNPISKVPELEGRTTHETSTIDPVHLRQLYQLTSEIQYLEGELAKARQECDKHHPTGGNVKQKIEANGLWYNCWDEVVDDLTEQLNLLVITIQELEEVKRVNDMKVIKLEFERLNLDKKLQKLEVKLKKTENFKADQVQKVQDLKANLERSAGQMALLEKFQGQLITAESHKANLDHKLQASITECRTLREQMRGIQQKWEETVAELAQAMESIAELQREVRVVENERIGLADQVRRSAASQTVVTTRLAQATKKDPESVKEIEALKLKVQKLERKFENREQEIQILEEDIVSANLQQAEVNQEYEVRGEKMKLLEVELETIKISRVNQKQPDNSQVHEIKFLNDQLNALRISQEQAGKSQEHEIQLLKDQILASQQKGVELERCCGTRDTTIRFLEGRQEGFERLCAKLQEDCNARDGEIELLKALNQSLEPQREVTDAREDELPKEHLEASMSKQVTVERQAIPQGNEAGAMVLQSSHLENKQLQQGHILLYKEHQSCQKPIQELKDQLTSLTKKYQNAEENLSVAKRDQFKAAIHQTACIQQLRNRITKLEQCQDSKDSFVKCVIDVRLGYLEHARTTLENTRSGEGESREVRVNAKIATQCANGQLDADILTHGLFPTEFLDSAAKTFDELYSISPARYCEWGAKSARLVNCQATLKTIPANESLGLSREDLDEYYRSVQNLLVLREEVGDVEFEQSEEAGWLIGRLEYLTGMIVAFHV